MTFDRSLWNAGSTLHCDTMSDYSQGHWKEKLLKWSVRPRARVFGLYFVVLGHEAYCIIELHSDTDRHVEQMINFGQRQLSHRRLLLRIRHSMYCL